MNLLDLAILAIFALFLLAGWYRGFVATLIDIGAFIASWGVGMLLRPIFAKAVAGNEKLYNMMLYYTEGNEYIADFDLARTPIATLDKQQIAAIVSDSELPFPMGKAINSNISGEVFPASEVSTLGEYYNQTIVAVFINIIVFILAFIAIRAIIAFIANGVDYAWTFPQLRRLDRPVGAVCGAIRGALALFLIFMLLPIALTVLGKFEVVTNLIDSSTFARLFYRSNFLLSLIPGTI